MSTENEIKLIEVAERILKALQGCDVSLESLAKDVKQWREDEDPLGRR